MYSFFVTVCLLSAAVASSLAAPVTFPQAHSQSLRSTESNELLARSDDAFLNERRLRTGIRARQDELLHDIAAREWNHIVARAAQGGAPTDSEAIAASFFLRNDDSGINFADSPSNTQTIGQAASFLLKRDEPARVARTDLLSSGDGGGGQAASFFLKRQKAKQLARRDNSNTNFAKTPDNDIAQAASFFLKRDEPVHVARTDLLSSEAGGGGQAASFFLKRQKAKQLARRDNSNTNFAKTPDNDIAQAASFFLKRDVPNPVPLASIGTPEFGGLRQAASFFLKRKEAEHQARQVNGLELGPGHRAASFFLTH